MASVGAILLAAGSSRRMGGVDKVLTPLAGRPLLMHSLLTLATHPEVQACVVVTSEANRRDIEQFLDEFEPAPIVVFGGPRRRDSVRAGLEALAGCDYVVVHDGARPFVTPEMVSAVLQAARETGAATCAVPLADTLKRGEEGLVRETLERDGLWLIQTPQAFRYELLLRAHDAGDADATDDASLVEALGEPVRLAPGSSANIKVTAPEDLALAQALIVVNSRPKQ